jgi:hypothetical protein
MPVCQKFFTAGLGIPRTRINTITRIIPEDEVLKQNRRSNRKSVKILQQFQ